jgi:ferredoxin--NADP+ reductase
MYKIVTKKELALKEKLFEVEAPDIAAKAQPRAVYYTIIGEKGERVPLTICGYDREKGTVSLLPRGWKTTKELRILNEGDSIENLTGPLGNPSEIKKYGKVLCVGGSIMIAPLLLQVKYDRSRQ